MKTKTLLASMAVASLAIAQPALSATRSADSLPQSGAQSVGSVERIGSPAGESEELFRGRPLLLILIVFGVLAGIIIATSGGKSPG